MTSTPVELLTITEACHALRISRSTLFLLLRSGDLEHVKIAGRTLVSRAEVNRYMAARRRRGPSPDEAA